MTKEKKKLNHVTLRLESEFTDKIDMLSNYEDIDKSALYRQAVKKGIKEISREVAIKLYADGEIGVSRAAHMADMYIGDFMELVAKRGIGSNITEEQYREAEKGGEKIFAKIFASLENDKINPQKAVNANLNYSTNPILKNQPALCEPKRKKIAYKASAPKKKRK